MMGEEVSIIASKLLTDGIHTYYPCERLDQNPWNRFKVYRRTVVSGEYMITDRDLRLLVQISQALLEDPTFDLVG
jgi:hypothetical protein